MNVSIVPGAVGRASVCSVGWEVGDNHVRTHHALPDPLLCNAELKEKKT